MKTPLTLERFRALAAAYGADLERWPVGERDAARVLVAQSPDARELVAAELELDRVLSQSSAAQEPAPELWRRLNEIPLRAPQRRIFWPFGRAWIPALSWAFAAVLGLGWGFESAPFDLPDADEGAVVSSSEVTAPDTTAADDELAALARGQFSEFEE